MLSFQRQKARREEFVKASRMAFLRLEEETSESPEMETVEGGNLEIVGMVEEADNVGGEKPQKASQGKRRKPGCTHARLARRMQNPDWLTSLPQDLGQFMMYARPAGKRVLLVLKGSKVAVVSKHGQVLQTATSSYLVSPQKTVLEGIADEDTPAKIYVTDVIQWKGELKVGEGAMFRHFWLNSNLPKSFLSKQEGGLQFHLLELFEASK